MKNVPHFFDGVQEVAGGVEIAPVGSLQAIKTFDA